MKFRNALSILCVFLIGGALVGAGFSIHRLLEERYWDQGMRYLSVLVVRENLNKWMMIFLILFLGSSGISLLLHRLVQSGSPRTLLPRDEKRREKTHRIRSAMAIVVCPIVFIFGIVEVRRNWAPGLLDPINIAGYSLVTVLTFLLVVLFLKRRTPSSRPQGEKPLKRVATPNALHWTAGAIVMGIVLFNLTLMIHASTVTSHRPNVVWILIDAIRADHVGCYGYEKNTTPFIDRVAREGIMFQNAYSQESYTMASVSSYFTSTYPVTHQVLYDSPSVDRLSERHLTLAEILKNSDYKTAAFVFNPHLKAKFKFGQGFDLYDDNKKGFDKDVPRHIGYETAARIYNKAERFLSKMTQRPLFLYLHYRDVHAPYVPPPPYHKTFLPPGVDPVVDLLYERNFPATRDHIPLYLSQYDGEIRYTDLYIEKTFGMLEGYGLTKENTVFIITSDHGEEFLDEHPDDPGGLQHGRTLYNEQIHVPLIISIPGDQPETRLVESWVELLDIAPTILELLGFDHTRYGSLQGRSLVPLIEEGEKKPFPVYAGGNHGRGIVISEGYKLYIYDESSKQSSLECFKRPDEAYPYSHREELFDISNDPGETRNLVEEKKEIAHTLREILKSKTLVSPIARERKTVKMDPETLKQLRALGYIQ